MSDQETLLTHRSTNNNNNNNGSTSTKSNQERSNKPTAAKHREKSGTESQTTFLLILLVGVVVRVCLINNDILKEWLQNRVEISTPLTSWNRVLEGIHLKQTIGLDSSYESDLVHEIPLMLSVYQFIWNSCNKSSFAMSYIFIAVDLLSAILLHSLAASVIRHIQLVESTDLKQGKYKRLVDSFKSDEEKETTLNSFLVSHNKTMDPAFWSLVTMAAFTINPFILSSCIAQSTVVFHTFILLLWLYFLINGHSLLSFAFLAVHANITVYSLVLIAPSISFLIQKEKYSRPSSQRSGITAAIVKYSLLFLLLTAAVFLLNFWMENSSMRFIESTYLFTMSVPDLLPNLGLFWYFFIEMFDHFLLFFTYVFQINVFIFTVPLATRLRNDPFINIFIQLGLIASLKSYPSVGETGFYLSMLPILAYLFPLMRNFIVYTCMLIVSTVLAPIMFYLWLGSGGGNANFYFAITLVYSIGQIFLIIDIFYAALKREFIKMNGTQIPKTKSGSLAIFSLE